MGRVSCKEHLRRNLPLIRQHIENYSSIYTVEKLYESLDILKEENIALKTTRFHDLYFVLIENNVFQELLIKMPTRKTKRYIVGQPSPYIIASTLTQRSAYFSHLSALYLHGLTEQLPKKIYTNLEQSPKPIYNKDPLEQKNIDMAFSRPMRETNQIADFVWNNKDHQVFLLSGKNHKNLGVIKLNHEGERLPCTSVERTLIDITVRPNYAGGIQQVVEAYENAKNIVSINKMIMLYKKMNFIYPYHQLIGFYLEKAGYPASILSLLDSFPIEFDFYVTYQMKNKKYSPKWRVFFPEFLD